MSLISFSPIQDGVTGVNAAATNTPLSTIYNDYNGNITDANISASAAIAFTKIAGGSATSLGAWQAYTPSFTNFTIGNGVITAEYVEIGKIVHARGQVILGSTSSMGSGPLMTLPITSSSIGYVNPSSNQLHILGFGAYYKVGAGIFKLDYGWNSSANVVIWSLNAAGSFSSYSTTTSTVPGTWTNGDYFSWNLAYEAA